MWFDCDSTLARLEGIDELAVLAEEEIRREVIALTDAAMAGSIAMDAVYGKRLELLRPDQSAVLAVGGRYVDTVVDDARSVVAALHACGKSVGIISGGLRPAILPLAAHLGIPEARVFAVDVEFDADGAYVDFDRGSPLARNGGKPEILAGLAATEHPIAFVGDGVTDLEAAGAVQTFIGFGGVARRERVVAEAEHFVDGPGLAEVLTICLTEAEREELTSDPRYSHLA